jgi:hypothetical protein
MRARVSDSLQSCECARLRSRGGVKIRAFNSGERTLLILTFEAYKSVLDPANRDTELCLRALPYGDLIF